MTAEEIANLIIRLSADDIERVAAAILDRIDSTVDDDIDTWRRELCIPLDDDAPDYLVRTLQHLAAEMRSTGLDPTTLDANDGRLRGIQQLIENRTRAA